MTTPPTTAPEAHQATGRIDTRDIPLVYAHDLARLQEKLGITPTVLEATPNRIVLAITHDQMTALADRAEGIEPAEDDEVADLVGDLVDAIAEADSAASAVTHLLTKLRKKAS